MDEQQASLDYLINQVWLFFFRIVLLLYVWGCTESDTTEVT